MAGGGARREICRNFLRGSCQYGARCKFLHSTTLQQQQQQSQPNNPFGFGTQKQQQQQQSSNPFGFGTQQQQHKQQSSNPFGFGTQQQQQTSNPFGLGTQQQKQQQSSTPFGFGTQQQQNSNPFGFGNQAGHSQPTPFNNNNNNNNNNAASNSKPNQPKPFENKWSRFSQNNNGGSQASRQPDSQPASAIHKCTDPDTCKHLINEDFENERPLWKLTCYGHNKSAPCDIVGDMSFEELRAAAYSDASSGLSLQSIVERERSFVNAKLQEFDSLLRNPYVPKDTNAFGQQVSTQSPSQAHSGFGMNTLQFGNTGTSGFQNPNQQLGNPIGGSAANLGQTTSLFPPVSSQLATSGSVQSPLFPTAPNSASTVVESESRENEAADNTIWQVEWKRGEVPEEAPPDKYISSI